MRIRLKIKAGGNQYRLAKLISAAAVALSVAALPALAGEAPPTGHGGGGIISGNNCFKTNSKTITEVCADYKVSWKLWTLMGEPVGDYKLKWELRNFTVSGGKSLVTYNAGQDIPPVLANEAKSIELYLDAIASVGLGTSAFVQQPLAFHAFNTGVATRAGKHSYNTPGSPKWDQVFQRGWGFGGFAVSENERHLSESEAKDIFKRSNQPDVPIQLFNLQIGPKSSVMELGALESRIAQLCANPDTASGYAFCPAIKKPEEKKAVKKNPIEDAFADLEKTKPVVPPKPISSVKDKPAKADKVVDDGFADVEAHRAKPMPVPEQKKPARIEPVAVVPQAQEQMKPGTVFRDCPDCPEMVVLPNSLAMGKTEVTQGQWKALMGSNPSKFSNCGDRCPVEQVSWNDAQEFIQKLNSKTGKQYRLPTEAEWEYACYGGSQTEYCGGGNIDAVAWYEGNSGKTTHPVGQKQANGYGLYDMSGNVWEWMESKYNNVHLGHALRGGSWYNEPQNMRAAIRSNGGPGQSKDLGFRLARTLP